MPSFSQLFRDFGRIGLLSFGGPAAQIALMHRVLVEERGWLSEKQFLSALSFCMLLPGPEAMQLATYAGWRLRGTAGGLLAGTLFVLPGALVIAALAALYASYGARPQTEALMLGVKATVIVIVVQALVRLWKKALTGHAALATAALAFAALFLFGAPFPLVVALAALYGWAATDPGATASTAAPTAGQAPALPRIALWAALWLLPLPVLLLAGQDLLFDLGLFFAKLAVVSFGGAYAVLAWMAQEVVQIRGWLTAEQMVDALGLAETTPGPLILVTQFTGQIIGQAAGGWPLALAASALTLWMTFLPCFLWIFAFAPHLERLLARPRLQGALGAVTAAVLGVIANLSLWFALHVLFAETRAAPAPLTAMLPVTDSLRIEALLLVALAALLLIGLKRSVPLTLGLTALAGWLLG
ncbi:chromate efflux transporter [Salipiger sp. P9]|uniref:chromate efflux transporter n=1 Tax=Salipiger pentaromativorans TaxID=2943193 RepID=UPI00215881D3|nr:chromate efflux transporter [Salipiger pentaromativorans]MCR8549655.1 chromate efflux transporter [Salipiger pentaromativorans]